MKFCNEKEQKNKDVKLGRCQIYFIKATNDNFMKMRRERTLSDKFRTLSDKIRTLSDKLGRCPINFIEATNDS